MRHSGAAGLVVTIAVMAGTLGASGAGGAGVESDFLERLRAEVLAASGGDLDRVGGTLTVHGAGDPVVRDLTGRELLELVSRHAASRAPGGGEPRHHPSPTFGESTTSPLQWPWCEGASIFMYAPSGVGGGVVAAAPVRRGTTTVWCGEVVETTLWASVTMTPPPASSGSVACGSAPLMWPHPSGSLVPGPGDQCGARSLMAHGEGTLISVDFFGMRLDYFLGTTTAHISVG